MNNYLIFDQDYHDIPLQDLPDGGDVPIVCLDSQKRLGDKAWSVLIPQGAGSPNTKGIFWDKEMAVRFAKMLAVEGVSV